MNTVGSSGHVRAMLSGKRPEQLGPRDAERLLSGVGLVRGDPDRGIEPLATDVGGAA